MARNPGVLYPESATHPDQLAGHLSGVPSWLVPVAVFAVTAAIITVAAVAFVLWADGLRSSAAPVTLDQSIDALVVSRAPVRELQTAAAPVAREWPRAEVVWSKPFLVNSFADLPPSLPAGKGFVRETPDSISNAQSSSEAYNFTKKILGITTAPGVTPVIAGVARDPASPDIVFAGFSVSYMTSYVESSGVDRFFLSTDGEKTWSEISLIYPDRPLRGGSFDVRVVQEGDSIILFARDPDFVAEMWRKATLSLKGLP